MRLYRNAVAALAVAMIAIGLALVVVTLVHGVGAVGLLLGALFVGAGAGRLWLMRRRA